MKLSLKQEAAVTRTGQDVCVVAGPGSGKTRVLIQRFVWLVRERKIEPGRILAVTFTEKAANEIKTRLVEAFANDAAARAQIERAYVSTLDSFCARLLRENAIAAGLDPEFAVLEEADAVLEEVVEETLDSLFAQRPEDMRRLLEAINVSTQANERMPDLCGALSSVYQALRVAGAAPDDISPLPPPAVTLAAPLGILEGLLGSVSPYGTLAHATRIGNIRDWVQRARPLLAAPPGVAHFEALASLRCDLRGLRHGNPVHDAVMAAREAIEQARRDLAEQYFAPLRALLVEALQRLDASYRARKAQAAQLDFADLEEAAIRLLESEPAVRERVRESFDQILMDELQDTNRLQWRLVDLLRRPGNFFAVGDVNQSIYGFRHADPEVFLAYQQRLESAGKVIDRLDENYRSRSEILARVEQLLGDAPGIVRNPLNALGSFGEKAGASVEVLAGCGEDTETAAEVAASWIAHRIREIEGRWRIGPPGKERVAAFSDIAILARTIAALAPVERALERFGIPSLLARGKNFYEAREARDLMLWLAVLANPRDEIALAGVLRSPLVGVTEETILRLKQGGPLWAGNECEGEDGERLRRYWALLKNQRALRDSMSPDRLLAAALDHSGYESILTPGARLNVKKFLTILRDLYAADPQPLAEMLGEVELRRAAEAEPDAPPGDAGNAVRLMSMHGAKGLEFPIVFLAGLHKGTGADRATLSYSPGAGFGVSWRDPATGKAAADSARADYVAEGGDREAGEENRLLYVAMTRAGEHLVLSYAEADRSRGTLWRDRVKQRLANIEVRRSEPAENTFPPLERAQAAEELLPRAEVRDQHDSIVTVTSVTAFADCPRRYYLARYLGFDPAAPRGPVLREDEADGGEDDRSPVGASEIGRQVHELLAGQSVEDPAPEAVQLAGVFRQSELGRRLERASRAEREFEVLMSLDDVVLRGTIDLWFEEGGELLLVDYKTDHLRPGEHPSEAYFLQLRLYALALERFTGRKPEGAVLFLLRTNEAVPVSTDDAAMEAARQAVAALKQAQNGLSFPLRVGSRCERCSYYRGLCPAVLS